MRRLILLAVLIAGGLIVWRARSARSERTLGSTAQSPPRPSWVEAVDGACPLSHPVKVKVSSGIYHLPGSSFYDRTRPERCYVDAAAAEADGYRAAKTARSTA
jgi:hypothetical protein